MMKLLVPVKRTVDANIRVRVKQDGSGVEQKNVKMTMNPFCEIALEEAIRLKEAGQAQEVILVSVGNAACEEVIRHGLAMGADRGILVIAKQELQPLAIARVLRSLVERESPDMVILGKQSIDGDNNQTGQMLAAMLDWPQGTFASELEFHNEEVIVTREVDNGLETLALKLPAVITTDLRLNEPRYLTLPNIMKAKKMPLDQLDVDEFGLDIEPRLSVLSVAEPPERGGCVQVESVAELVDKLHSEARVI
jgi:electron transfer flavoprotein beta subunit